MTLLELIVVLVLLSIVVGVVALTLNAAPTARASASDNARILAARDSALRYGGAVSVVLADSTGQRSATAYADGRVIADSTLRIDPLSGHPYDARR